MLVAQRGHARETSGSVGDGGQKCAGARAVIKCNLFGVAERQLDIDSTPVVGGIGKRDGLIDAGNRVSKANCKLVGIDC